MKVRRVFVDMDGVLVNFVKGACAHHNRPDPYVDPANHSIWDFPTEVWKMPVDEFYSPLRNASFWRNLEWMPDGRAILLLIEEAFGRDRMCLLTAAPGHEAVQGKMEWIEKHIPKYRSRVLFVPAGSTTKGFCAGEDAILFDDYDKNIEAFKSHHGQTWLVPRLWNSRYVAAESLLSSLSTFLEAKTCR